MPIPKEILAVERPKNTVVVCDGKNKDRYAVKQRIGCKYDKGRRVPVNGPTIGHIKNFLYVPKENDNHVRINKSKPVLKDWANIILADRLFKSIFEELCVVYHKQDALTLYCIAILRVCEPGIKDHELKEAYDNSFLSELYPDVSLSKNIVSTFINDLGKTVNRIIEFMGNRAKNIALDHHLLIDGTLKFDESKVNTLSDFSRKAKVKGRREISVLYAFDLENREPVCSKCYPGNMLDLTAYEDFISESKITRGIIVADKGFPSNMIKNYLKNNPDLHYLNPIRRNSNFIKNHHMLKFTNQLENFEGITYRKEKVNGGNKYLYSFRDSKKAYIEEKDYLARAKKNSNYNEEDFSSKQASFGTIVLESDYDMTPLEAYQAYSSRWEIELVMRFYKSACKFNETRVQDDYSVIGSEFCDFLSTILTFRLINSFDKEKLLETNTYKKIMSVLRRAKKIKTNDNDDWELINLNKGHEGILKKLKLIDEL